MTKTIVLNERQQQALRFCLGGRHRLQTDPPVLVALGEIEAQLNASNEESPAVASEEVGTLSHPGGEWQQTQTPADLAPKAKRGGRK